jgi:hypothetical protein
MVLYQNRVRNKFNPNNKLIGGGVRSNLYSNLYSYNYNTFIPGSSIGALNISVRRALYRRARARGGCTK